VQWEGLGESEDAREEPVGDVRDGGGDAEEAEGVGEALRAGGRAGAGAGCGAIEAAESAGPRDGGGEEGDPAEEDGGVGGGEGLKAVCRGGGGVGGRLGDSGGGEVEPGHGGMVSAVERGSMRRGRATRAWLVMFRTTRSDGRCLCCFACRA